MVIKKEWSVLTVGDGDLSFSRSIFSHFNPKKLTATVLDSEAELTAKYGNENLLFLQQQTLQSDALSPASSLGECQVITEFDVTDAESVQQLAKCYDLVIFQFPLVPNFANQQEFIQQTQQGDVAVSINTINRRLLRLFLRHSFSYLLSETGAQLAYISSKDVKPYTEWDIEYSLSQQLKIQSDDVNCVGVIPFHIAQFPGYRIRNVDRDRHVKDTGAATYIWTLERNNEQLSSVLSNVTAPTQLFGKRGCDICHAGPFASAQEKHQHLAGKKHKRLSDYNSQWQHYLNNKS